MFLLLNNTPSPSYYLKEPCRKVRSYKKEKKRTLVNVLYILNVKKKVTLKSKSLPGDVLTVNRSVPTKSKRKN